MTESVSSRPSLEAFAELDHDRAKRRGYPEAIYCPGKTPAQVAMIAAAVRDQPHVTLFTRASKSMPRPSRPSFPALSIKRQSRRRGRPNRSTGRRTGCVRGRNLRSAGCQRGAAHVVFARSTELVVDVGVAGLHRVPGRFDCRGGPG
jgi:NCAIR mutase (PurE)-related protein